MKKLKIINGKIKSFTLIVSMLLFIQGCLQSPSAKRTNVKSASTSNSNNTTPKIPVFTSGNNFIQNGINIFSSNVSLELKFSDSLQLRGKDVDSFIRNTGTSTVACFTAKFQTTTPSKRLLVFAAIARSVYNFSTETLEYYFNITPSDATTNSSFCQKTGVINKLQTSYPGYLLSYKLSDVCISGACSLASYTSDSVELYTSSGSAITQIASAQLKLLVSNTTASAPGLGQTCTESTLCQSQGFDCCSLGQCVKDLALKPNVATTSGEYLQALQDILNNPSNIYLYPQYYFICSQPVNTPTNPTPPSSPTNDAAVRLKKLRDLHSCTSKVEGEYGVCTVTYPNIKTFETDPLNSTYSAGLDDRNFKNTFSNIAVASNAIVSVEQVLMGEVVLFDYSIKSLDQLDDEPYIDPNVIKITALHNDDLTSGAQVQVLKKPASAISNDLVIRYKIDASCTKINTTIAKCEKYYVQEQNSVAHQGRVTDHNTDATNRNDFKIPYYANVNKAITVEVDGVVQKREIEWILIEAANSIIRFIPDSSLQVFKDQKVKISYFVDLDVHNVMESKLKAQAEINKTCGCNGIDCKLTPIKNSDEQITDYACVFPEANPPLPPVTQKAYLSSKSVPVRYFDSQGTSQKTIPAGSIQEGNAFSYRSGNLLNPNNIPDITKDNDTSDTYVGFNEIYGSLSTANNAAKPALELVVKKGNTYDIYVDKGSLSNCIQCGNDYYSQLTKLFPLTQFAGGVNPLLAQTNRTMSAGIRADEMKFGRACMVPASMIPWSHRADTDVNNQRKKRMATQHFLYANGYQHDWYGFDYGAVIGSFDGVKWFAVGTNRRIKAESNKIFLAINAPFGDLSLESTFEVTVNDGSLNPVGSNMVTSDYASDAAQCQQFHQCSTDTDCATTLGWEYSCTPINTIQSSWPIFDENGKEIPESIREDKRLVSILGINANTKRCVYRGRGALCSQNYSTVNVNSTWNESTNPVVHSCSSNTYCQPFTSAGLPVPKFNNKISRFGKVRVDTTVDSFGLGAPIPGRPYNFEGLETPQFQVQSNLSGNRALAMCLPGRDVEESSYINQHNTQPADSVFGGDKTLGIGMTRKELGGTNPDYLLGCAVTDTSKNYFQNTSTNASALFSNTAVYDEIQLASGSQSISTNALDAFKRIFTAKSLPFATYKRTNDILTAPSFTENRCMRAPGASCFTDLDCAPSKTIADKIKSLSSSDTTVTAILNKYEVMFWQEELVCSQAEAKISTNTNYDPRNNRCCREVGKTISLPTADAINGLEYNSVAGIDYPMASINRYSRAATVYKEINTLASTFPNLNAAVKDQCSFPLLGGCESIANLDNQFRTFSAAAEKTSCSGDWVRNFATGGHKWDSGKFQSISANIFKCFNWLPGSGGYTCSQYEPDDPACPLIQTQPTNPKAKAIMEYFAKFELMGIPQIAMQSELAFSGATEEFLSCRSHPSNRANIYPVAGNYLPPNEIYASPVSDKEYTDGTLEMYSAIDNTNFKSGMKMIFKADEVSSCLPAGTQMKVGDDANLCCTGMINAQNNKCQLPDYVDLSVYTNRYVSSEAKKLNASLFDANGYIKDADYVANIACEKQMCASGVIANGVLISRLKTPGQEDLENKYFRFLEGSASDNQAQLLDLYKQGLKFNNHAYCVPKALADSAGDRDDIRLIRCGN